MSHRFFFFYVFFRLPEWIENNYNVIIDTYEMHGVFFFFFLLRRRRKSIGPAGIYFTRVVLGDTKYTADDNILVSIILLSPSCRQYVAINNLIISNIMHSRVCVCSAYVVFFFLFFYDDNKLS